LIGSGLREDVEVAFVEVEFVEVEFVEELKALHPPSYLPQERDTVSNTLESMHSKAGRTEIQLAHRLR
jgi:hypothetical protein